MKSLKMYLILNVSLVVLKSIQLNKWDAESCFFKYDVFLHCQEVITYKDQCVDSTKSGKL